MIDKYYWAYKKLKGELENERVEFPDGTDYALLDALTSAILQYQLPKGDGKFSRVANYVENVRGFCDFVKVNWHDDCEVFTAFMAGVDVTFEAMERMIEIIKKGR